MHERFFDVVKHHASFAHGARDGGKVVVGQHQIGRLARRVGAVPAHGHANVGGFECRGVVDAVARHGHQMALALQCRNQAQFVFGRGAGKHVGGLHVVFECGIAEFGYVVASQGLVGRQTQLPPNGGGGDGVVASDHFDADARPLAFGHSGNGLVARRVDDAHQSQQFKAGGDVVEVDVGAAGGPRAACQRQHALAAAGGAGHRRCPVRLLQRLCVGLVGTQRQHTFGCAFDEYKVLPRVVVVQCDHELTLRLERDGIDPWPLLLCAGGVQPSLVGQCQQRAFGGVTVQVPVAVVGVVLQPGIVAQQGRLCQPLQAGVLGGHHGLFAVAEAAFGRVARA